MTTVCTMRENTACLDTKQWTDLIKGFAADVAQEAIEAVQMQGKSYNVVIEEDQVVSANDGY